MIELHYYPGNASMAPHLLLEEIGVPFELRLVDRAQDAHKSPAYLRLNPNGLIPVLVDGDLVLYESVAICLHLVDTHPGRSLAPAVGTPARAHFYKWLVWLASTMQPALVLYFYPERWADSEEGAAHINAQAEARVAAMLDQLDAQLARHGGPWLLGDTFSAVDLVALLQCRWTRAFARPARDLPHVGPYLRRLLARPPVQRVFAREGLLQPWV